MISWMDFIGGKSLMSHRLHKTVCINIGEKMRSIRYIFCFVWISLMGWMLSYRMYISFVYSIAMLWCFWPSASKKGIRFWLIIGLSPLVIWNVGLIEYGRTTIDLHCRVLGFTAAKKESFCSYMPQAYKAGQKHKKGPLFSAQEHIGVHGFNFLLASGGFFAGLPEVAWETFYMSFASDPTKNGMENQSKKIRQNQCKGKKAQKKDVSRGNGNWMFSSRRIRTLVAKEIPKAKKAKKGTPKKLKNQLVEFKTKKEHGNNGNGYYGELMRTDNIRVPLTLAVSDGTLYMEAQKNDSETVIDVVWRGSITYPSNSHFTFPIPTIYSVPWISSFTGMKSDFPILLSEGIFCGMLLDGAMNAYTQEWHTVISISDERIGKEGRKQSQKGWIEFVLGFAM